MILQLGYLALIAYFCPKYDIMKVPIATFLCFCFLLLGCQNQHHIDKRYLITKNSVGHLTKGTRVNQLDSIFSQDSVLVKRVNRRFSEGNTIVVYGENHHEQLLLKPAQRFDSTSVIASVEIVDTLYQTRDGLRLGGDFEVAESHYRISRIENILGAAVVFLDDLNVYFTIDKAAIKKPTKMGVQIKASQIKDTAEIQHLWVSWN